MRRRLNTRCSQARTTGPCGGGGHGTAPQKEKPGGGNAGSGSFLLSEFTVSVCGLAVLVTLESAELICCYCPAVIFLFFFFLVVL